jgi:2-methylisocitrate lyase-like PEP mutase family enzyme
MSSAKLSAQLSRDDIVVAPGIYDAFGGVMAEQAGFSAAYLSGASIAYTRFGRPDIGLVGMSEVADTLSAIAERVETPLIVDADTGFGNALNVQRTVRLFERSGAGAIQLEDQTLPKRCGHLAGKTLVSTGEMVGKIKAATDARRSEETLIIARTDAIAVEGFEAALDRADAYCDAGADVLFVEAPRTTEEMTAVVARFRGRAPLLANMVEGGKTPLLSAPELQALGFSLVIFPGGLVRAAAQMAQEYFASLRASGTTTPYRNRMLDFDQLNGLLGTSDMLDAGAAYDASKFESAND